MEIKKIYFDMDGVLADFNKGVKEICGLEPVDQGHKTPQQDDELFEKMREAGHFYYMLDVLPGAEEMFKAVRGKYGERCEILSGIPKASRGITYAAEDKRKWMAEKLDKDVVMNIVLREEKPLYCTGKDCILIDDFELNIKEWEREGGTGVLSKNAESTMETLKKMGIL